jgi:hypothetical protein
VGNYYATRGGTVRPWAFWPFWRSNGATEHHRDSRTDSLRRWRERHLRSSSDSRASCLGGETTRLGARLGACFLCVIGSWHEKSAKELGFQRVSARGTRKGEGAGFPARIGSWDEKSAGLRADPALLARGASQLAKERWNEGVSGANWLVGRAKRNGGRSPWNGGSWGERTVRAGRSNAPGPWDGQNAKELPLLGKLDRGAGKLANERGWDGFRCKWDQAAGCDPLQIHTRAESPKRVMRFGYESVRRTGPDLA